MPKPLRMSLVLCLGGILLAGCAERWTKAGATNEEFETTKTACTNDATIRFPARLRMVEVSPGSSPQTTVACSGAGPSLNCHPQTVPALPPSTRMVDDAQEARDREVRACLIQKGWTPAS